MDRVVGLPLGVMGLVLVGGEEPQCGERSRVVLARVRGGEAEERQGDLGVGGLLHGAGGAGLTVGGLRGAGGLGGALGDRRGLGGVGWSLPSVRLKEKEEKRIRSQLLQKVIFDTKTLLTDK